MFSNCTALKGGNGTAFDSSKVDKTYARIDGGPSAPGYFTRAPAAKAVVEGGGKTLRFVYDGTNYGTKGTDWFSVAEAEAIDPCYDDVPWYGKRSTVTKVVFADSFKDYQPTQCGSWFYNFENLATIVDIGNLDTSAATSFAYMFSNCSALTSLDVTGFDTAKVTDMSSMFSGCSKLVTLDVTGFDTAKVTDMSSMFSDCSSLTSLALSGFNTAKVTYMGWMFYGCSSLTSLDVTSFDTSKVTSMGSMFRDCSSLKAIAASEKFVTTGTIYTESMFSGCTALVGGRGTAYDPAVTDKTYARIDDGPSAPGYFTKGTVYTVAFDGNGATSGTMVSCTCRIGQVYNLPKCAFTKTGKAFKGWAGSNGRRYDDGVLIFNAAAEGKTLTLTAIWE